jgi:AraC-like DNA-binding protein
MSWQTVRWDVGLSEPPRVVEVHASWHGSRPIERYYLAAFWQVHIYQYDGDLRIHNLERRQCDGVVLPIRPGHASVLPPNTYSEYRQSGPSAYLACHFSLPDSSPLHEQIPVMQNLGGDATALTDLFEQMVAVYSARRRRADVKLWELLWRLSERRGEAVGLVSVGSSGGVHPAVDRARQLIELRLGEPISVAEIASHVGLSHCHLLRLFQADIGTTLKQYIIRRRVRKAEHLLVYSTQPIKQIASTVGIPDLHLFNKTIRRYLGVAPQTVRASGTLEEPKPR